VTTFDQATASTTADNLLDRLRSGARLTPTERAGLAELFATVQRCRTAMDQPGHDSYEVRSGLMRNIASRFDDEFGPAAARGMCGVYRALHQPSVCGHPDADHPLCGCCPDTCDCPEQARS
jgi:hypothetical protein